MEYKIEKESIFGNLYQEYMDDIYKVCLHYAKNEYVAQDIMQQAFTNFYEHIGEVQPDCVRAYLVRSSKNLVYNYYRTLKHEVQCETEEGKSLLEEFPTASLEEEYFGERQQIMQEAFSEDILEDMKKEHEGWYKVIMLLYVMGKSYDEAAKELGISKGVLYSRSKRAKYWARKNYGDRFDELFNIPGI